MRETGALEQAEPLTGTVTATTVRVQNGTPVITDGPFAETKEQLAGYYILDCKDLDEAMLGEQDSNRLRRAAGCVEIRRCMRSRQAARRRKQLA